MSIKISSALRDNLLDTGSLYSNINGHVVRIYAGAVPSSADDSISGNTLLCTISTNGGGTGLQFETTAVNGLLAKQSAAVWTGDCVATGTATFYRLSSLTDAGGASTSEVRVQGTVGLAGADLNVTNTTFTTSEERRLDYFVIGMPTG